MAFHFKVDTSEENVRDFSGGNGKFLNKSGMYDIIIKSVIVEKSPNGSEFLNLWIEHDGQEQPLFQAMRLINNDGSPNLGAKLFTKLCVIAGATDGDELPDPVSRMVPIGPKGEEKECMVLSNFDDLPVTIRLQMSYALYNGEIKQNKDIRNFFRFEDKATASEIINNSEEKGKQYAIEAETADKVNYRDGLTEEDIIAWRKEKSSKKSDNTPSAPKQGFGQKRSFGKK